MVFCYKVKLKFVKRYVIYLLEFKKCYNVLLFYVFLLVFVGLVFWLKVMGEGRRRVGGEILKVG